MTFLSAAGNRWCFLMNRRPAFFPPEQWPGFFFIYDVPRLRGRGLWSNIRTYVRVCVRVTIGRTCYLLVKGRNAARRFTRDLR